MRWVINIFVPHFCALVVVVFIFIVIFSVFSIFCFSLVLIELLFVCSELSSSWMSDLLLVFVVVVVLGLDDLVDLGDFTWSVLSKYHSRWCPQDLPFG